MKFVVEKANLIIDKQKIIQFWKENFSDWPEGKYSWFYQRNIAGLADCWVVKENGKESVIGTTAIFPRKFRIKGEDYLAGITGDFAVNKQHRILGPALKLQREVANACENGKYQFLYGTPNSRSDPVQKRAGFVLVGSAIRMVKVLHTYRYLKRLLKFGFLAKFFSVFLDLVIRIFAKETWYRLDKGLEGKFLKEFDSRFDELWEAGAVNFPLIGERSQKFLTWRFHNCPYQDYTIFVLEKESDKSLLGYLVFTLKEKNIIIIDCFARDKSDIYQNLIAAFLKQARHFKIDSISIIYLGDEFFSSLLREFNFSPRADKRDVVAYIPQKSNLSDLVKNPENWYFLAVDND